MGHAWTRTLYREFRTLWATLVPDPTHARENATMNARKKEKKCQIDTLSQYTHLYVDKPFNDFNTFNIKQDSGAWVLIFEGFWVLKMVFEWCRIHIKMVFAQHYSLVVFYPILLWFKYALFIQANPVQVGPGPPKSAQVLPGPRPGIPQPSPPRFSEKIPETPQNRRK